MRGEGRGVRGEGWGVRGEVSGFRVDAAPGVKVSGRAQGVRGGTEGDGGRGREGGGGRERGREGGRDLEGVADVVLRPAYRGVLLAWPEVWFSRCGQFTRIGHIPGGGRPLLREGGPISYETTPSAFFSAQSSSSTTTTWLWSSLPNGALRLARIVKSVHVLINCLVGGWR